VFSCRTRARLVFATAQVQVDTRPILGFLTTLLDTKPKNRITEELPAYGADLSAIGGKYEPREARAHQSPVARFVAKSVNE
jgi:hypothetical protein